jgi:hypothetical protein
VKPPSRFRVQFDALVGRGLAVRAGAWGTLGMLLLQAPLIGFFIGLAWQGEEAMPSTYFVMAVAAMWMGCLNACTEIVSERAVYERERMFHLDIRAYLSSKILVLAGLSALQGAMLLLAQEQLMHLKIGLAHQFLAWLALAATGTAAAGLGLLVSAFSKTPYGAVVTVPILLIPQVVFSEILLQKNIDKFWPSRIEALTLTKWCYEALFDLRDEVEWLVQLKSIAVLALFGAAFTLLAAAKLRWDDNG